jgi:hypothetical protein
MGPTPYVAQKITVNYKSHFKGKCFASSFGFGSSFEKSGLQKESHVTTAWRLTLRATATE